MTQSVKIEYNCDTRFFQSHNKSGSKVKIFNDISIDFISGFQDIQNMIPFKHDTIAKILDYNTVHPSNYVVIGDIADMKSIGLYRICSGYHLEDGMYYTDQSGSYFKQICERNKFSLNKRYTSIISSPVIGFAIIQFDSLDYLSAIQTYSSWTEITDLQIDIECVFDNFTNFQHKTNYQIPFLSESIERYNRHINHVMNGLIITDLTNIVFEYFIDECQNESKVSKCITKYIHNEYNFNNCPICELNGVYEPTPERLNITKLITEPFICKITV